MRVSPGRPSEGGQPVDRVFGDGAGGGGTVVVAAAVEDGGDGVPDQDGGLAGA